MLNRFKQLAKLSKTAVIYSILIVIYELIKAITYIHSFAAECSQYGENISKYWGYVINGVLDNYVVVPAGLIIIALLCVKIVESHKAHTPAEKALKKEASDFYLTLEKNQNDQEPEAIETVEEVSTSNNTRTIEKENTEIKESGVEASHQPDNTQAEELKEEPLPSE